MMLNGAIAALVAITAACAFVAPWGAILIGFVAGVIVVFGILLVERIGLDDPVGAIAAHGMSGVWGTLALGFLTVPSLAERLDTGKRRPLLRGRAAPARRPGARPRGRGRIHVQRVVPRPLCLQEDDRHPHRRRGRACRPGHLRARHVGVPRVLHPRARRIWNGRAPAAGAAPGATRGGVCVCERRARTEKGRGRASPRPTHFR